MGESGAVGIARQPGFGPGGDEGIEAARHDAARNLFEIVQRERGYICHPVPRWPERAVALTPGPSKVYFAGRPLVRASGNGALRSPRAPGLPEVLTFVSTTAL